MTTNIDINSILRYEEIKKQLNSNSYWDSYCKNNDFLQHKFYVRKFMKSAKKPERNGIRGGSYPYVNGAKPKWVETYHDKMLNEYNYKVWDTIQHEDITEIKNIITGFFSAGLTDMAFELLYKALIHPKYAHICKTEVTSLFVDKYYDKLAYALFYTNTILRYDSLQDLSLKGSYVFTLQEALNLPQFNVNLENNPWFCQIVGVKNVQSYVPFRLVGERKINSIEEFNRRFNYLTNSAFKDINFKKYNACVTGSILVPCLSTNPLEKNFPEEKDAFAAYAEFYYPSYASLTDEDMKRETVPSNFDNMVNIDNSEIKISSNVLADIDLSVTADSAEEFDKIVKSLYQDIVSNCQKEVFICKITTPTHYKYKIYGPGLTRSIDCFNIKTSPLAMVARFHLNIVRMYYDGEVIITRDCLMTHLTGVCDDYKWFSCNKIPADVIMRYIQRGFSIILNQMEIIILRNYLSSNDKWLTENQRESININTKLTAPINKNHVIFRPDVFGNGCRTGLKVIKIKNKLTYDTVSMEQRKVENFQCRKDCKIIAPKSAI